MDFHLKSWKLVLYGWEEILQGEYCWLVPDLILSIVCGHVLFFILVVCFLGCVFKNKKKKKKNPKTLKISKRQNFFILCLVLFFLRITWIMISLSWFRTCLILWKNLNNMCYISAKLFLILCQYVLVSTCTHGLVKKLIFLVCVPSTT